jgi:hypothetical protein
MDAGRAKYVRQGARLHLGYTVADGDAPELGHAL